jgi:uncharacterized protein YndB with AHSA1/START domain
MTDSNAQPGAGANAALAGMKEGWNRSLDRLAEYLPKP